MMAAEKLRMNKFVKSIRSFTTPIEPWWTIVLVPIWQEFIFRYLPFQFWYLPTGNFWLVGIVTSVIFALIHWYFGKWFVAAAFLAGLLYWWVMVNYGLIVAIVIHAVVNTSDVIFGLRRFFKPLKN